MDEKQGPQAAYNEATEGYPPTGNPRFAGNQLGYPSSYPPQLGYGGGSAAEPEYTSTQQGDSTSSHRSSGEQCARQYDLGFLRDNLLLFAHRHFCHLYGIRVPHGLSSRGLPKSSDLKPGVLPHVTGCHRHWMHLNRLYSCLIYYLLGPVLQVGELGSRLGRSHGREGEQLWPIGRQSSIPSSVISVHSSDERTGS